MAKRRRRKNVLVGFNPSIEYVKFNPDGTLYAEVSANYKMFMTKKVAMRFIRKLMEQGYERIEFGRRAPHGRGIIMRHEYTKGE